MSPAVVLRATEEVKRAHGHGEIRFLGKAFDEAAKERIPGIGIHFDPSGGGEDVFHGVLRAENQEIDHVAGLAVFVGDAAGNFGKQGVIDAGDRLHSFCSDVFKSRIRRVDFDAYFVGAFAEIIFRLIDAHGKPPADSSDDIGVSAKQKRLRGFQVTNAAKQRAASRLIERQDAEKIFEAAREAVRAIVFRSIGVAQLAGSGDNDMFARLHVKGRIYPKLVAGDLNFLGGAKFSGRRFCGAG